MEASGLLLRGDRELRPLPGRTDAHRDQPDSLHQGSGVRAHRAVALFEKAHLQLVKKWEREAAAPPKEGITQ